MSIGGWAKALVLGLIGVVAITGLTYFNDQVLKGTYMVGNNMPFSVYGSMIAFMLTVNLGLFYAGRKLALTGQQIAVAVGLTLAVCSIPGSGLLRTFGPSIIAPHHLNKTQPGWKDVKIVDVAPSRAKGSTFDMLVDVTPENENKVLTEYLAGWNIKYPPGEEPGLMQTVTDYLMSRQMRSGGTYEQIPWYAWSSALKFWIPLVLLLWISLLGLALVAHRQWSDHEHLPYPIVDFTNSLLPDSSGKLAAVFQNKLFWLGATIVFAIHMNNYLVTVTATDKWILLPLRFDIKPLFIFVGLTSNTWQLDSIAVFFTVVAFSFMLSSSVSFSVGISALAYLALSTILARQFAITLGGGSYYSPNYQKFLIFGSYLGMLGMILYTGRHYFLRVAQKSIFLPTKEKVGGAEVLGMRIFLLGSILSTALITTVGLDWQLALLYVLAISMMFFIMSRIIAETGLFFIQVFWLPCGIIAGLFGAKALGPETMLILYLLSMVLAVDPREAFMPFIINVLKLTDKQKVKLQPMTGWVSVALIIGMMVGLFVTMSFQYRTGAPMHDAWAMRVVPREPFNEVVNATQRLQSQGVLEASREVSGFGRFAAISPTKTGYIWSMLIGLALVVGCSMGRLKWNWWPLHPVIFLIWAAMPARAFAWSFLIGWLIKLLTMKYGGAGVYQKVKPLMFGLIAGEMVALLIPTVVGIIHYLATGESLPSYRVFPG